jgi:hypothetical protein
MEPSPLRKYTCSDYREEMRLLALMRRLEEDRLTDSERGVIREEIERIERSMAMG